ncbi:DUF2243 domain-containing protein [Promicromonospora xylanilytica]
MAAIDEIAFHRILAWHHFYDYATPDIALVSDGPTERGRAALLLFQVLPHARRATTTHLLDRRSLGRVPRRSRTVPAVGRHRRP